MATPLVTLSLPTVGRVEFLSPLREAVRAQTFGDYELLILDNACPPDAREKLAAWAHADARVRHLASNVRLPMFENFNRGFEAARGKYLVTLNDDDLYLPAFLERMIEVAERHDEVGFVGCNFDFIDERGAVTEERRWIRARGVRPGREYIRTVMRNGRNPIVVSGTLFRREAMAPKGFDPDLSPHYGDFVIMMRIAERYDVGYLTEPLMRLRRHRDQASIRCDHATGYLLLAKQFREYVREYRARWPEDERFARELSGAFRRSNRIMSLWGWLTAPDDAAAAQCLGALAGGPLDRAVQAALSRAAWLGLNAQRRRRVAPLVRRVGNALQNAGHP